MTQTLAYGSICISSINVL